MRIDSSNCLFWNVDTQIDFVYPRGKLYIEGAEELRPQWKELTRLAGDKSIRVMNTADYHFPNSAEFDASPDFIHTFPEHCMANTRGADFIKETDPDEPVYFNWNKKYLITPELFNGNLFRNFVIRKDAFDVFKGNPYTKTILKHIHPRTVIVYGVSANTSMDAAVRKLTRKVETVYIIEDAIKAAPALSLPIDRWKRRKVNIITLQNLKATLV